MPRRLRERLRNWLGITTAETMLALEIERSKRRWARTEPILPPIQPYPDPNYFVQTTPVDTKVTKGYGQQPADTVDPGAEPGNAGAL